MLTQREKWSMRRVDPLADTVRVTLRMSAYMRKYLKLRAEMREEDPSEFMRYLIRKDMARTNIEPPQVNPRNSLRSHGMRQRRLAKQNEEKEDGE